MAATASVNPVFMKAKDIPATDNGRPLSVLDVCLAAERVSGQGTVVGAQQIGGLWRLYPATREARNQLLIRGLQIRGTTLQLANTNPFILRSDTGEEKPSTKVFIDNIPISIADSEIEHALLKTGCELRSAIKSERARDPDNRLTRFLTGRRFLFITVPPVPLEKTMKVSIFTAKIYHREQKSTKKSVVCSRCLGENHHVSQCHKEVVCRACKKPGHKQGDPACQPFPPDQPRRESENAGEDKTNDERMNDERKETTAEGPKASGERDERVVCESECQLQGSTKGKKDKADRGRGSARQPKPRTTLPTRSSRRQRSSSPRTQRSSDTSPEPENCSHKTVVSLTATPVMTECTDGTVHR